MNSPSFNVPKNQKSSRAEIVALIRHTLSLLAQPGQTVELRIPGMQGKRTDSGYFNDFDKLAAAAADYENRAEGIYITVNPVQPALLARSSNRVKDYAKQTTSDKDVLRRRWLFIDFDPVRPAGISSSDEENAQALERATACREKLAQRGIPSLLANSGNGAHLLIPIDWPNDEASTALVKEFLTMLDAKFSDEHVKVDTGMVGASHLIKLYGTMARKGDCIPERPHRRSALLEVPTDLALVSAETIQKLLSAAQPATPDPAKATPKESKNTTSLTHDRSVIDDIKARFDMVGYAQQHLGVQAVQTGSEYRLPGNGGFLINPEKGVWYHHSGQEGGDALDLIGYCTFGTSWNCTDANMFKQVLQRAATFTGISLPSLKPITPVQQPATSDDPQAAPTAAAAPKTDLLDAALAWQQQYGNDLAWDVDRGGWRRWTGTFWKYERTSEMIDLQAAHTIRSIGSAVSNSGKTEGLLKYARGLCKRNFKINVKLVNFSNGTLDPAIGQLHEQRREDHLTRCLPYNYTPDAAFPQISDFLTRSIPDPVAQQAYMTHVGAALVGDTSLHKALVLMGATNSGKSMLLNLAQLTLGYKFGQYATSTVFSAEGIGANSRAKWLDTNPNLVCVDEFPQDGLLKDEREEMFKSMTAHGGVSMWLKYQDERDENTWTPKLILATNNKLRYRDQSGALTRRLVIIECPNTVADGNQDADLLQKLQAELGAFSAACLRLALEAQRTHKYPMSAQMIALLGEIETNGDAVKLWLMENCVFEESAFESTATLYGDYRQWSDENGVSPVSRPKLRDIISTFRPEVKAARQRVVDPQTGEIKPIWGLVGIRLRTSEDDFPDDDPTSTDPVDPVQPFTRSPQEPDNDAIRSGDPVDSGKSDYEIEEGSAPPEIEAKEFSQNDRITGSAPPEMAQLSGRDVSQPAEPPAESGTAVVRQTLLLNENDLGVGKTDVLQYYPDLGSSSKRRST